MLLRLNRFLEGQPDRVLTLALLLLAALAIGVALWAPPAVKLGLAAWLIAP